MEEVHTVIRLVQGYYSNRSYCIITPYDAQRAAISRELARSGLPDSVFNVDSFQGAPTLPIYLQKSPDTYSDYRG